MLTIILLSIWAAACSGWFTAWYYYRAGKAGTAPDLSVTFKLLAATGVSLFLGCVTASVLSTMKGGIF